jgi:thioester reductase-like protein
MASFESRESSEIINYYKDKSIFITGATGFLGKVLIEKLLRTCYDLKKIYILIRHKKGKTPQQRLNELVNCQVKTAFLSKSYLKYNNSLFFSVI